MRPPEEPESPEPCPLVPDDDDVRTCIVCGHPLEGRTCKYVCRPCGVMVDGGDAF